MQEVREENNKLFIGNLSFNLTEADLTEAFSAVEGVEVVAVKIINDRETGRPRGFGFVTVATPEMAQIAIEQMHGKELDGRAIAVNIAKPQSNDRGGDRGGNRGGYNTGRRY